MKENDLPFFKFKILQPLAWNCKKRNKGKANEHSYIKYSYSYMFRPHWVIIRLAFKTYSKKYTYRIVEVRYHFLQIYLQFQSFFNTFTCS